MEIPVKRIGKSGTAWSMVLLMAILGGVAGCASIGGGQAGEVRVRTVWKARDQYVAIEKQDRHAGIAPTANAHPADLPVERLRSALESIDAHPAGKDVTVALFKDPELNILGEKIREGLASAAPDEDVTFAVIGHYPVLLGLMRERKVTTGRVFCLDGQLNIIFGDILRDVKENEDRRLFPFLPGSRASSVPGEWTLVAKPDGERFTLNRSDWATFPLVPPRTLVVPPPVQLVPGSGVTGDKAPHPVVSPEKPGKVGKTSVEERLIILNELRNKKLITDEEYRMKRQGILDEL